VHDDARVREVRDVEAEERGGEGGEGCGRAQRVGLGATSPARGRGPAETAHLLRRYARVQLLQPIQISVGARIAVLPVHCVKAVKRALPPPISSLSARGRQPRQELESKRGGGSFGSGGKRIAEVEAVRISCCSASASHAGSRGRGGRRKWRFRGVPRTAGVAAAPR
jgi:hypothetical protein